MKQCIKCKQWKDENNFAKRKDSKDGLSNECKDCRKLYYLANRDRIKEQAKQNYYKNHNRYLIYDKQRNKTIERINYRKKYNNTYREENKEKLLSYDKERNRKRWLNIDYKINKSISTGIYRALKENKKGQHWETLVPYTLEELKQHLENQFTPEMSWENYGTYWEIDHIIPRNLFNINSTEGKEFQICWSLINLRPLTITENRSRPKDGSDISEEIKQTILNQ